MAFKFTRGTTDPFGAMQTKGLVNPPPTNPNNPKTPEELAKEAEAKAKSAAQSSERVLLKPGEAGYDPTKKASYVQKGSATIPTTFTKEGNEAYAKSSQEERDAQNKKWKEIQEKKAKIYSYEDKEKKPGKESSEIESTSPNPRVKNSVTADYIGNRSEEKLLISGWRRNPEWGRGTDNFMSEEQIAAMMKEKGIKKSLPIYVNVGKTVATTNRAVMNKGSEREIGRTGWQDEQDIADEIKLESLKKGAPTFYRTKKP